MSSSTLKYPKTTSILKFSVDYHSVALLELNRPEKRNALSQALITQLVQTIAYIQQDEKIRAVVLTGCPEGPFSGSWDFYLSLTSA
jgi:enoyl-CoA hydratase/carnithine racemase